MEKEWYVVNAYSGHENKVKEKLEMRASTMGMEDCILQVVVPEQVEVEYKNGEKKEYIRKMFPGYIFIQMIMTDEAWFVVRNTPGVTGFIGSSGKGAKPFPLSKDEVERFIGNEVVNEPVQNVELELEDVVKVVDGPFSNMFGKIKKLDYENNYIEIALDLFGQETIVELAINQVEKS